MQIPLGNMKTKKNSVKAASAPNATPPMEIARTSPAPAAPAPVISASPKPAPAAASASAAAVTVIDVKHDVGFGNALYLRGQGGGLNWEHGVPLVCVDGKTWRWSGKVKDPLTFKLLINDKIWSAGNDMTVKPGQKLEIRPTFS